MPIEQSNLLNEGTIMSAQASGLAWRMQEIAVKQKAVHLLRNGRGDNELVNYFMGKNARSMLMQQHFDNQATICALVTPEGEALHFDADGNIQPDAEFDDLSETVRQAWDEINPGEQQHKAGLVLSAEAFAKYMAAKEEMIPTADANIFKPVLSQMPCPVPEPICAL